MPPVELSDYVGCNSILYSYRISEWKPFHPHNITVGHTCM